MHEAVVSFLPHLAHVAREARIAAGLTYAHIAVHVVKRNGKLGVSDSTVARFEYGRVWPENPDAMIHAYNTALGLVDPCQLWREAATACAKAKLSRRRRRAAAADGDGNAATASAQGS